jgi:hypothetical protein
MATAPSTSAAPRGVKREEPFVPDTICGSCPHCSRKGTVTELSFNVGFFPTPSGKTYGSRDRVPSAPTASAYLGVCPRCSCDVSVAFLTVKPDATELKRWNEAREANKRDSMFTTMHPMPCQKHYTNGFF